MILISHRGNINGIEGKENHPDYIDRAIENGYDVEVDVRQDNRPGFYLGHDKIEYHIETSWLLERSKNLWIHAKDFGSLELLLKLGLRVFYHEKELHTIIGNTQVIWSHNIEEASQNSIIPLLELDKLQVWKDMIDEDVYGICSDYVGRW